MTLPNCTALLTVLLLCVPALAGPKIEISPRIFQCGTIYEAKADKLLAHFSVTNPGDSVLVLSDVRPGCGCTVVKYDSLVLPGKSANMDATVNIKGYHSGTIVKSIMVTSNALNEPTLRLDIAATINPVIDASENFIGLDCTQSGRPHLLYFSSVKKDLKVTEVSAQTTFNPDSIKKRGNPNLSFKFEWAPADSGRSDGYHVYKLTIFAPDISAATAAVFSITTNHPDKPNLIVSGQLPR
jgi:hypothetical protein